MESKINQIAKEYLDKLSQATTLKALDELFLALFGKNGVVTLLPKDFPSLGKDELKIIGPLFNKTKHQLEQALEQKRAEVKEQSYKKLDAESLDLNSTEIKTRTGHMHPTTVFENQIAELFSKLGFQQYDAPHIDTDYYNFEGLNIPQEHPARDLWDTLYIDTTGTDFKPGTLLLRTHTSNAQLRSMKDYKPPIRMMVIDRCFRYENLDARHEHTFEQFEIVYVDKGLNMGNLQYLSEYLLKNIFGEDIKVRLKPKYYPFVEPGAGVDGICIFCKGQGCKICSGKGWLELAGAGMMHPTVIANGGLDPNEYSGIAWGFGPDRMVMLKYALEDLRLLKSGDLKFLQNLKEQS